MTQDIRQYITIIQESYSSDAIPEEFITTTIQGYQANVHWDKLKSAANKTKHGYTLDQGIHALNDRHAVTYQDHMLNEDRFRSICRSSNRKLVTVVWSSVDTGEDIPTIRIIGMREATTGEVSIYKKQSISESDMGNLTEQVNTDDIPEIPANAKMVPMQTVMRTLVSKFKQKNRKPHHH